MTTRIGLWIDHRKAVLVSLEAKTHQVRTIESNADRHAGHTVGADHATVPDRQLRLADDIKDRHFEGELKQFYDEVVGCLGDAERILILGPGEAKGELKARLEHAGLGKRVVAVEASDKLTDHQLVSVVRDRLQS